MAKIYFNDKIIKHLPETTILNFFVEPGENGSAIYIRDTRPEVYKKGRNFIIGDLSYHKKDKNFYIDITPLSVMDGQILGVYVGDGVEFKSKSDKEPIFYVAQKNTEFTLGMTPNIDKPSSGGITMLGMYHLGTIISFKRDGIAFKDQLTPKGWKRIQGPDDRLLGIMTTAEAFEKASKQKPSISSTRDRKAEVLARAKEAAADGAIPKNLAADLEAYLTADDGVFFFLHSDFKKLKEKGII
jgi:hypothetical protein